MINNTDWKTIRIIILAIGMFLMFVSNPTLENYIIPHVKLSDLLFAIIGTVMTLFFMIWIGFIRGVANNWRKLDWNSSPFSFQPIILFNFSGWIMMTGYFLPTILTWIKYPQYVLDGVFPMVIGLSMILVTNIASNIFIK